MISYWNLIKLPQDYYTLKRFHGKGWKGRGEGKRLKRRERELKKQEDAKIKPLADVLESFYFVEEVFSVCGGHYWSKCSDDHRAIVNYSVKKKWRSKAEELWSYILEKTHPYCFRFVVEPGMKAYPVFGDELRIMTKQEIIIKPHRTVLDIDEKRRVTDKGIDFVTKVLEQYLRKV
ncbi:hypothetical protein AYK26_06180 [Euryarchaeota archaeon SM23-78]|nr:MAG: hypothetical protein AYK26_06180 [Euryarchaeota archaeon SM23-78]MBW3001214.1 hypothetical protein [Candidatus Woesearchaeota archaeon]